MAKIFQMAITVQVPTRSAALSISVDVNCWIVFVSICSYNLKGNKLRRDGCLLIVSTVGENSSVLLHVYIEINFGK